MRAPFAAILALTLSFATIARADEPPRAVELFPIDATRPGAVVEKLTNKQEQLQVAPAALPIYLPGYAWGTTWETVCVTPCRVPLDRNAVYRVTRMNGIAGSKTFTLPPDAKAVHVEAHALWPQHLGIALSIVGTVIAGLGVLGLSIATNDSARASSFSGAVAGVAMVGVGLPLWIFTRSKVSF